MSAPRVTVGLPVYNGEKFLQDAIDSILAQDFDDFELLIGDNGSTDRTAEICREAAARDDRVKVHRSEANKGAAWNYNRLVRAARGRYFKWAAHDDVLEPAFLSRCVELLEREPDVALAYTRAVDIDASGAVIHQHDLPGYATQNRPSDRAASILLHPSPCMESFGLTRTAQLLGTSLIGAYTGSDRTLFLELALLGRFHEVPEVLFLHRQHEERSVKLFADDRSRNIWFDPMWQGRRSAPRWRLLREYGRALARNGVAPIERIRMVRPMARWTLDNRRTLAREAATHLVRRGTAEVHPLESGSHRTGSSS